MPTVAERLADHFIKAAGIAGVYADARGALGAVDVVGIERESLRWAVALDPTHGKLFCCRKRLFTTKTGPRCWFR